MMVDPQIRSMTADDTEAVVEVARALPAWFNDDGLTQLRREVPRQLGLVAEFDSEIVGFVN